MMHKYSLVDLYKIIEEVRDEREEHYKYLEKKLLLSCGWKKRGKNDARKI
jgi:hypothetical protein